MATIADRIDELLKNLGLTERELARRANLPAETHIGYLRRKLREDPGAVTVTTLEKIAHGGGVSLAWLVAGETAGPPVADTKREAGAVAARAEGVWEPAILSVLAEPLRSEDVDRSPNWWALRMALREEELIDEATSRRARSGAGSRAATSDAGGSAGRAKKAAR